MKRHILVGLWILALIVATSQLVVFAAAQGALIAAAPVLAAIPVLGLFWLQASEELAGWAVFTVWLGSTYVQSGIPQEYAVFGIISLLAVLGYFRSSWFLVAAWVLHIGWDFVPRDLPEQLRDLPVSCVIFDGLIAAFIAWRTLDRRWPTLAPHTGVNQSP